MFTQPTLSKLLLKLYKQGVAIRVITDASEFEGISSKISHLSEVGIPIKSNKRRHDGLMHHKFLIIDNKKVVMGSFNWTTSAVQNNYESVIISSHKSTVEEYSRHFARMWSEFDIYNPLNRHS